MSRPLRIEYPGSWYHVMNRGRRREDIFFSSTDYETFLQILREASANWNLEVSAYCLMPNHYHLLVHTPNGNLSRCMRHVNGVYTQRFNRKTSWTASCFEEDTRPCSLMRTAISSKCCAISTEILYGPGSQGNSMSLP